MSRVRNALVRTLANGLYRCGGVRIAALAARHIVFSARSGLRRASPAFSIFTYHRVNDEADPFFASMPTEVFERQIAHVARVYRVLPLEDLVQRMRQGTLPRNAVAVTFDDGYRDTLTHAAPILARHGVPATVFLATGFIGTGQVPWVDRVALAFKVTEATEYVAPWGETVSLATAPARVDAAGRLVEHLKRLPDDDRRRAFDRLLQAFTVGDEKAFNELMLTWDDVNALVALGFSIGAHTVNHPILSRVSAERAREEIEGSRATITSACGRPPQVFAYPNGGVEDYTPTVARLVCQAGFSCAVTTRFGVNTRETSPWELRRGGPPDHHLPTFALKLAWYQLGSS